VDEKLMHGMKRCSNLMMLMYIQHTPGCFTHIERGLWKNLKD